MLKSGSAIYILRLIRRGPMSPPFRGRVGHRTASLREPRSACEVGALYRHVPSRRNLNVAPVPDCRIPPADRSLAAPAVGATPSRFRQAWRAPALPESATGNELKVPLPAGTRGNPATADSSGARPARLVQVHAVPGFQSKHGYRGPYGQKVSAVHRRDDLRILDSAGR